MQSLKLKNLSLILVGVLFLVFLGTASWWMPSSASLNKTIIKTVSAEEIYPMFLCPCCGKTIDTGCCPMAKERKAYVDGLVAGGTSKDEIISLYVKKYGLNSFKDEIEKEKFRQKLIQQAPVNRPIISIQPENLDLGNISQANGIATTEFEIKNIGKDDLIIDNIETSCGCTSASVVYNEIEGPIFSMPGHGINEKIEDWQASIAPGDSAQLKVYYDPNMHEEFRGTAIREIHVFSNDPIDFETKVQIELNQVE